MSWKRISGGAVLVALLLAGGWLLRPDSSSSPSESAPEPTSTSLPTASATTSSATPSPSPHQPVRTGTSFPTAICQNQASDSFTPTTIAIPHVTTGARVLALGYDARGVPGVPPISDEGKAEFAWVPEIHPGAASGNVLLNAHTWPDGTALGNHLLAALQPGGRIVVHGTDGAELCYRVTERREVDAAASVPDYFASDGPPQLAIVVCSGTRLGPGNWTKRTLWFASPGV